MIEAVKEMGDLNWRIFFTSKTTVIVREIPIGRKINGKGVIKILIILQDPPSSVLNKGTRFSSRSARFLEVQRNKFSTVKKTEEIRLQKTRGHLNRYIRDSFN